MRAKYYLAAIIAFSVWGMFSFVLKPLQGYPSPDILFYRIFLSVTLMLAINLLARRKQLKETKNYLLNLPAKKRQTLILLTVFSSVMLSANWFFFIYVMNHISVKAAAFSYLICPILTTVCAFIILRERLTPLQWFSVLISASACVLLSFNNVADLGFSLLVAGSYALYLVIQKKFQEVDKFVLLSSQLVITALILLPFYFTISGPLPAEPKFYIYIAIIAIGFTIIPMLLNLFALKGITSSTLGILMYLNPIIGFVLAAFYYKEEISATQIVAYSLIGVAIVIFNIGSYLKLRAANK
ncbi:permease [Flavobacterium akiainvivens]|uniref:Permease n=1 Tax=Flavobacterium akiainvivens TaxID=1202724 RepID=A0A0M8MG95_9FLAO|nr:EamA family transporter [Flavobacterium akiainvivens]KOS08254.1 permease [Flavobacterium akiainvivens]SFQ56194.1 chloramphenicol-sensitive protein RarD [Flavobacterium akiainvivens]